MSILAALLVASLPFHTELHQVVPDGVGGAGILRPAPGAEAAWTAPTVRGALPFRDALPSWNVDAPPGTAFVVELRVAPEEGRGWSPWLHVGDWGERELLPALAQRVARCAAGRVEVDVFLGEGTCATAELRVRAFARAAGGELRVRRLSLCLRDRERAVAALAPPAVRPLGRVLDVPPRSQRAEPAEIAGRICSPTSVAMLLAFRGVEASTATVAAAALDPFHDLYGVWPRNVQVAWSLGVPGYVACFSDWSEVERAILAGTPLVVSLSARQGELAGAPYASTPGHLIVLCGFDAAGDCVVNDPAVSDPAAGRRTYARRELETVWMRRGGVAYVLEARP
ncbi:MAG: C39 family peptidase [Planctomycetes bacterium]|nr:C39 family peptidase [Planctomycetota bacterium]